MSLSTISTINKFLLTKNGPPPIVSLIPNRLCSYTFESGTAGTVTDDSGNGYHATNLNNAVVSTQKKFGTYSCTSNNSTGSTMYIQTPTMTFVNANGLSFSLWLYPNGTSAGDMKIFEFTSEGLMMWSRNNGTEVAFANGTVFNITQAVWTHIVITITSSSLITIYKNSVQQLTQTIAIYPAGTSLSGRLLRSLGSNHHSYKGYIDQFKIFNKILTVPEIDMLYNNTDTS